jgi:2-C-methyl-D-erythritol 2,4-cyclodiphosphate synthase
VGELVHKSGNRVVNIDATIIAEHPRLSPYVEEMAQRIADALEIPQPCVSVKATTTEKMGFTGRGEGIAAMAVSLTDRTGGMITL